MELPVNLILLGLVINRITEAIKAALPAEDLDNPTTLDRWRTLIILALSFVLASVAMLAVFPSDNLFPSASSPAAGLIFSGILVGGIANGWDFLGGLGEALVNRVQSKSAGVVNFSASVASEPTSKAA